MILKKVKVEHSVGMVLAHDITQIIPGVQKGPLFRKGHIVKEQDIPHLLNIGKEHLYLLEQGPGWLHENEAAIRLANCATGGSANFVADAPSEGRINIKAAVDGLLKIDVPQLARFNSLGEIIMATLHGNRSVRRGETVAGTRIIPLVIEEEKIIAAEKLCAAQEPLVQIRPYRLRRAALIVTGSEVKKGRIIDKFGPVVQNKLAAFGVEVAASICLEDDPEQLKAAIQAFLTKDAGSTGNIDLAAITGGMSVDPDDVTPSAIKATGAEIVSYGAPVLPGAMFMLAYLNDKPVMGLPGCVMYNGATIFDLILPRILAGERVSAADLAGLGHGGLCFKCPTCHYPNCAFGKGV